ncbi:hypothetical protein [Pseudoalteromonas gelatinilytica]
MNIIERVIDIDEHWKVIFFSLFLIFIGGIMPSIYFTDWGWFARSGALLVCFGVYIAWLDYKGKIDRDINKVKADLDPQIVKVFDEFNEKNQSYFNKIEFFVVIIGTLIWGYGDLIGKLCS